MPRECGAGWLVEVVRELFGPFFANFDNFVGGNLVFCRDLFRRNVCVEVASKEFDKYAFELFFGSSRGKNLVLSDKVLGVQIWF